MADDETAPTEFEITTTLGIKFSAQEIVDDLGAEKTIQLIKELDAALEDWGATEELAEYFDKQMEILEEEEKAIAAKAAPNG